MCMHIAYEILNDDLEAIISRIRYSPNIKIGLNCFGTPKAVPYEMSYLLSKACALVFSARCAQAIMRRGRCHEGNTLAVIHQRRTEDGEISL